MMREKSGRIGRVHELSSLPLAKVLLKQSDLREQLREIKERLGEHDVQLNQIYDAMENLLDEKSAQRKWDDRDRIGFKK